MHEAAITAALVEQVRSFLPEGADLVSVRVEVGALEHLDPSVMESAFAAAIDGTALAGARLEIDRVPLRIECGACGTRHEPVDPADLLCPGCGAARPRILAGSGVRLMALTVDGPEDG